MGFAEKGGGQRSKGRRESIGIISYGVHIPRYRISLSTITNAWGGPARKGEKAVANYDEDSLTMGVSSALDCFERGGNPTGVDTLLFASTTSPFGEKLASPVIATVADLSNHVRTGDCLGSLRSGTIALLNAFDAVKSGSAHNALIVASDCRLSQPGSDLEVLMGDGSAALLIGTGPIIAEIVDFFSISDEFTHFWRRSQDKYVNIDDVRFVQQYGYMRLMSESINGIMSKNGHKPSDFSKVVLTAVDSRSYIDLARRLGFDYKTQLQDPLLTVVGNTGAAQPFLLLVAALESSKPGDKILFVSYGDGSDAFVLEVKDEIERIKDRQSMKRSLQSKRNIQDYNRLLSFRYLISGQAPLTTPFSSLAMLHRERDQNRRFYGRRCKKCQTIQFLQVRVCPQCHSKDEFEMVKLAKEGELFTYCLEHYYPTPDPPTIMAMMDVPPGARVTLQMTDTDPDSVKIGMGVELTFRKYHEALGIPHYFWKCRAKDTSSK